VYVFLGTYYGFIKCVMGILVCLSVVKFVMFYYGYFFFHFQRGSKFYWGHFHV